MCNIKDPGTDNVSTDTLTVPVNPSIAAVLARYPMPNYAAGAYGDRTYATASKVVTNANQFSLRIDHKFSDKDQFFARFNLDNLTGPTTNPDQTAIDPKFGVEYIDRQRNVVGTYTRTVSPRLTLESSISIIRSTPGFPTSDHTDPAIKFNDGLFEAFNGAGRYGDAGLRQPVPGPPERLLYAGQSRLQSRVWKSASIATPLTSARSPNGEYDFGGGPAYATEAIPSDSGNHNVQPGDLLPDTLSAFLAGNPFAYNVAIADARLLRRRAHRARPPSAAITSAPMRRTRGRSTPRFTLDYGLRWDLYTPITERAHRTASLQNHQWRAAVCYQPAARISDQLACLRAARTDCPGRRPSKITAHAGGGIMAIPPNIWQDNFLTGSTPFVDVSARGRGVGRSHPIRRPDHA